VQLPNPVAVTVKLNVPAVEGVPVTAPVEAFSANPGGKLPMTFPRSVGQVPIFYNHKPSGGRSNWHGDYVELSTKPLYCFGHGLSYTQFEYSDLSIEPRQVHTDGQVTIRAQIANVGHVAGDEVVQLYIRDQVASIPRPVQELKAFARITLAPGETRTVEFVMPMAQLAFHNQTMQLVVEPGTIQVMVGSSAKDIRLNDAFEIGGREPLPIARRAFRSATHVI